MQNVKFDFAFMFKYSERPGTSAQINMLDDVPEEIKLRRLQEVIKLQSDISLESNKNDIGKTFEVLVEGISKKSDQDVYGRNQQNKVIVFPGNSIKVGDFTRVKVTNCTSATLIGVSI